MDSPEDKTPLETGTKPENPPAQPDHNPAAGDNTAIAPPVTTESLPEPPADDPYNYSNDPYEQPAETALAVATPAAPPAPPPAPPPVVEDEDEDPDEGGMLRMSFLEHLEELRFRIVRMLLGVGVAFVLSLIFTEKLWDIIQEPAAAALKALGVRNKLVVTSPTEPFTIIWVKLPVLTAIFIASPWILYQIWSFIAPGLYKKERRWAAPFIIVSAGLFIAGGLFGYFVAFPFGLQFLLSIAVGNNIEAMITISEYFDTFCNVTLALGMVFEVPVLIFFLALIRLVTPQFLIRNSRYAILIIVILAAVITPTPDAINLMIISVPMAILYFGGVFAAYLLWLSRENQRFPWFTVFLFFLAIALIVAGIGWLAVAKYGYHLVPTWPFLVR